MRMKESEEWLHKGASHGWEKTGIRKGEQFHRKYRMQLWYEDREMVFHHIMSGRHFRGLEAEVCSQVDAFMHNNGYYKSSLTEKDKV